MYKGIGVHLFKGKFADQIEPMAAVPLHHITFLSGGINSMATAKATTFNNPITSGLRRSSIHEPWKYGCSDGLLTANTFTWVTCGNHQRRVEEEPSVDMAFNQIL